MNSTHFSHFRLAAYVDTGQFRFVGFLVLLSSYILAVGANLLLIVVICTSRSLHEPMYMFLCSLFLNEVYGSTGLLPLILVQILSDVHTVSKFFCFLQIYCIHCYGTVEYFSLAVMSYDRYLAICYPLQYNARMTFTKIAALIAAAWLYSIAACGVMISLSSSLQLCGNRIYKVYCDNFSIVKLACSDTTAINIYGLCISFASIAVPLTFILYTYIKILTVCVSGSKQSRQKAVSTCTPHLTSVLHFTVAASFEIIQARFDMSSLPILLRIILSLYWFTVQPLLNPLVYGLKLSKIRILCKSLLFADM